MVNEFWRGALQEIIAGISTGALCAFFVWLHKSYRRFVSIDQAMTRIADAFPKVLRTQEEHGDRIERLEIHTGLRLHPNPPEPAKANAT